MPKIETKASDSRQSVDLKWKLRKGLEENVAFEEDGTMEVGKNLEVDGNGYFGGKDVVIGSLPLNGSSIPYGIRKDPYSHYCFVGYADPTTNYGVYVDDAGVYFFYQNIDEDYPNTRRLAEEEEVSKAKYQHTVTIKATATADAGGCYITFTAYSSKNTPIDSYQDLHSLFGGCALSASGAARLNAADSGKGALKLDLHGGTVATDAIVCLDASGAEHSIKLSALGSPAFSDDVCVPK